MLNTDNFKELSDKELFDTSGGIFRSIYEKILEIFTEIAFDGKNKN